VWVFRVGEVLVVAGLTGPLGSLSSSLSAYVRDLEPERLSNDAVLAAFDEIVAVVKVAEAGRALLARVIDERGLHRRSGHLSAAHLVAASSGTTVGAAAAAIETGRAMSSHEALDYAFRSGSLSAEQAVVVADAVAVDASAEHRLLDAARVDGLRGMRAEARAVKAAAECDRLGRYERQRCAASFRHGIDQSDGMVWGQFRLPPDDGAAVVNRIERETDRVFREAHRAGRRDRLDRYAAEALVRVVTPDAASDGATRGEVMVLVSRDALRRGHVERDEVCVIPGFGEVPVEVPRRLLEADAFLTALLCNGDRVQQVKRFGRRPSAAVRSALLAQAVLAHGQVVCDVDGCDRTDIEWDHTLPWADGGPSNVDNLTPRCRGHHRAKTLAENQERARAPSRGATTKRRASTEGPAP
jgi:hypothetical protein